MASAGSRGMWRRAIYLLVGVVAGIFTMVTPALLLLAAPKTSGFDYSAKQFFEGTALYGAAATASPIDVLAEVLWLVLPALVVILAVYWLAVHRTRSAGYDEAAKWSRR